jgi:hypothetical protein
VTEPGYAASFGTNTIIMASHGSECRPSASSHARGVGSDA